MTFNNTTKRLERPWTFTSQFAQGDVALRSDFDAVLNDAVSSVNAAIAYLEAVIAGSVIVPTDQRYLGTKATAPALRNDGGSLQIGDLFVLEATQQPQVYTSLGWARANDAPQPSAFFATLFNDPDEAAFRSSIGLGTSATYPASAFASAAQGITADNAIPSAGQVKITDFNAIPVTKSGQYWADAAVSNGPGPAEVYSITYTRASGDSDGILEATALATGRRFMRRRASNAWQIWQAQTSPAGTVIFIAQAAVPVGYLKANGAAVSRTTYSDLFAAISTTFGAGNGTTTFDLPDLRGEFLRGWDDGRGVDSGRARGSFQADAFQGHGHNITATETGGSGGSGAFTGTAGSAGGTVFNNRVLDPVARSDGTPRTASETRPRNIALLACIKY